MSYEQFIQTSNSEKKVLVEIDQLAEISNVLWIKEEGNVWKYTYAWDDDRIVDFSYGIGFWGGGPYGEKGTDFVPISPHDTAFKVSSVLVNESHLTEATSIDDCISTEFSFYWNEPTQTIYVHTKSGKSPRAEYGNVSVGVTKGYSNISGYYGNLYYDSRVRSIPNIERSRDPLYYGKISFEGGSITLVNTDGHFDIFARENYNGAKVRILLGGDDLDITEYKTVYTGYIDHHSFTSDEITIELKDNRKLLSTKIPQNTYTATVDEDDEGSPIGIGYGVINKALAINTIGNIFKFVDTAYRNIRSINSVYIENVETLLWTGDLVNGEITLNEVYEDGDEVTVSFDGYVKDDGVTLMDNPIDIIQDLLTTYTTILYNDDYFNKVEWEAARTTATKKIGIYKDDKTEIIDIIGEISSSIFGLFGIDGIGKLGFRFREPEAESVGTLFIDQIVQVPKLEKKTAEYLNSVRVGWGKNHNADRYRFYINESRKKDLFLENNMNFEQEFKTVLSNEIDAGSFSEEVLDTFGGVFPTFTVTTGLQHTLVRIGDNMNLEVGKYDDLYKTSKLAKVEVLSKVINLNNFTTTLILRQVGDIAGEVNLVEFIRYNPAQTYSTGAVTSADGQLWRAIDTTSGNPPIAGSEFWDEFGKLYWEDFVIYQVGDLVIHDNIVWQATANSYDSEPNGISAYWRDFAGGAGSVEYIPTSTYGINNVVQFGDSFYKSLISNNRNHQPDISPIYWGAVNLNAELLDGHDSSFFLPATSKAVDSDLLDGLDSTQFLRSDVPISGDFAVAGAISEGGTLLSNKYLGISDVVADSELLNGHDSSYFLRSTDRATDSDRLDGLDSTNFLRSNGKATDSDRLDGFDSTHFLRNNGKAIDSDKLDGYDSTHFLKNYGDITIDGDFTVTGKIIDYMKINDSGDHRALTGKNNSASNWIRTPISGLLPYEIGGLSSIGTAAWSFLSIYGINIYDGGILLEDKYLGKGSKAVDSGLLEGLDSTQFLRSDADDTFSGKLSVGTKRSTGIYGDYDPYKTAHVWSMGAEFTIDDAGAGFGNLYGIAYKHTLNTTGGTMAGGHQIVFTNDGTPGSAIGLNGNIWTKGTVYECSTALSNRYLGISDKADKAADSELLDGLDSTNFLRSGVSSGQDVSGKRLQLNLGGKFINIDPRWNHGGHGVNMSTLNIWGTKADGSNYGQAGLALFDGSEYHYILPMIDSSTRHQNKNGYIEFGPKNSSWAHIYTDRPNFYFNKDVYANGNKLIDSTDKVADSNKLDGLDSTQFLRSTGKAVDSDKLDGLNSTQFLRSDQNDNMSGKLQVLTTTECSIYGCTSSCFGVYGYAAYRYGVKGEAPSYGVVGSATNCYGVLGTATNFGVYGGATNCYGVYGCSPNYGVYGKAVNYGVKGYATGVIGVIGESATCCGVVGSATTCIGVVGSATTIGVYGTVSERYGVYGCATLNYGVYGHSTNGVSVGGNTLYNTTSDEDLKIQKESISVLSCLRAKPIQQFKWRWERAFEGDLEYIAPMAQDVQNTFNLDDDNDGYSTLDGIALFGVQELMRENEKLKLRIKNIEARLLKLEE